MDRNKFGNIYITIKRWCRCCKSERKALMLLCFEHFFDETLLNCIWQITPLHPVPSYSDFKIYRDGLIAMFPLYILPVNKIAVIFAILNIVDNMPNNVWVQKYLWSVDNHLPKSTVSNPHLSSQTVGYNAWLAKMVDSAKLRV